ncbi:MAG: hypothetical protein KDA37_05075 [Planctomycetales bacterium]|nr:hypothetical protein [Planctomycetales bacterium]
MPLKAPTLLLLLASPVCAAGSYKEAPQEVELTINGEKHLLMEGQASRIEVNGRAVSARVVRRPASTLKVDRFTFTYPSSFSLLKSQDGGDSSASWMLKGKKCQLTIHRKDKSTTLEFLTEHMSEFYKGISDVKRVREKSVSLTCGSRTVKGVRFLMDTKREGTNYQDYFQLPVKSERYNYFLVVHAKPGDTEADQAKDMLASTLQ